MAQFDFTVIVTVGDISDNKMTVDKQIKGPIGYVMTAVLGDELYDRIMGGLRDAWEKVGDLGEWLVEMAIAGFQILISAALKPFNESFESFKLTLRACRKITW